MRPRCSSLRSKSKPIDAVKADLDRFDAMIDESADLRRLVRSPVFTADEQLRALAAVLDKAGIGGLAANFLQAWSRPTAGCSPCATSSATSGCSSPVTRAR